MLLQTKSSALCNLPAQRDACVYNIYTDVMWQHTHKTELRPLSHLPSASRPQIFLPVANPNGRHD